MVHYYNYENGRYITGADSRSAVWIHLFAPTIQEINYVSSMLQIENRLFVDQMPHKSRAEIIMFDFVLSSNKYRMILLENHIITISKENFAVANEKLYTLIKSIMLSLKYNILSFESLRDGIDSTNNSEVLVLNNAAKSGIESFINGLLGTSKKSDCKSVVLIMLCSFETLTLEMHEFAEIQVQKVAPSSKYIWCSIPDDSIKNGIDLSIIISN